MAKKLKDEIVEETTQEVKEEGILVTFSQASERFNIVENQARIFPGQLKENEKFVEKLGKIYIEAKFSTHTELL